MSENRKAALAVSLLVIASLGWWFGYVKPRQEFLLSVAACTGPNTSQTAWKACVANPKE